MLISTLDHIVVGAKELNSGTAQLKILLDCEFLAGGKHTLMATHNSLLKLQKDIYLEVIATDPDACPANPIDGRKRWFALDAKSTQDKLARTAQPLTWVIAVSDIEYAKSKCGYDPGEIIEVSRGDLKWRLTVPADGSLIEEGVLPSLIEWPKGQNPANHLPESGVGIKSLVISHPNPERILDTLEKLKFSGPVETITGERGLEFNFVKANGDSCALKGR